ncbi:hypothetical protein JZ751_012263 [Albula glossodonta]|uniref:Dymeclin n=1 Tax=Albula glossodonta TaxID=121402 RepID=A0A8T2PS41_9TELE|nr:hypothetical protein JZ751_012263 [Albula glossodonta]
MPRLCAESLGLAMLVPVMSRGQSQDLLILTGPVSHSLRRSSTPVWELGIVLEQQGGCHRVGGIIAEISGHAISGHWVRGVQPHVIKDADGGLWTVFTLGGAGSKPNPDQEQNPLPLSNQSLLLLLVLANLPDGPDCPNPYRQAVTSFKNTQGGWPGSGDSRWLSLVCLRMVFTAHKGDANSMFSRTTYHNTSSIPSPHPHTFQINFNSLYTALCDQQRSDQATLLLYTLLHQNANVRTYVLSRTDMENLRESPVTEAGD